MLPLYYLTTTFIDTENKRILKSSAFQHFKKVVNLSFKSMHYFLKRVFELLINAVLILNIERKKYNCMVLNSYSLNSCISV